MNINCLLTDKPQPGTLIHLANQSEVRCSERIWAKSLFRSFSYRKVNNLAEAAASFFRSNHYHLSHHLFIDEKPFLTTSVILLGAIKAGIIVTDIEQSPATPEGIGTLVFTKNKLKTAALEISFKQMIAKGKNELFYSYPQKDENEKVFYLRGREENSVGTYLTHLDVRNSIRAKNVPANLHFYLRLLKTWTDGKTLKDFIAT